MFTNSIRWRLQLWLAFLLVCVLSGFGFTVYQLQRVTQIKQLDEELERRVAALNLAVRGGPLPEFGRRPPFDRGPGSRDFYDEPRRPPPRGRPDNPPGDGGPGLRGRRREVPFSAEAAGLFSDARPGAFYFTVWSHEGSVLRRATNGPTDVPLPARLGRDTSLHTRMRDALREAYQFTELGDCVLTGRSFVAD